MGRLKKDTSPESTKQRHLSRTRFRDYYNKLKNQKKLNGEKMNLEIFASEFNTSTATIKRWLSENKVEDACLSTTAAKKLAKDTGIIAEWWLGITDCKTQWSFDQECANLGLEDYSKQLDIDALQRHKIENLLSLLGFTYEDLYVPGAKNDFAGISNDAVLVTEYYMVSEKHTPHKIIDPSGKFFQEPAYLSDTELSELLQTLQSIIGYSCYRKLLESK